MTTATMELQAVQTWHPLAAGAAPRGHPGRQGGWAWILSDLGALPETGRPLAR